jgi:hypothetical protein
MPLNIACKLTSLKDLLASINPRELRISSIILLALPYLLSSLVILGKDEQTRCIPSC